MKLKLLLNSSYISYMLFSYILLSGVACSKSNSTNPPVSNPPVVNPPVSLSSAKTISAFSFQTLYNSIPVSSDAIINGSSINIFLPPGTAVTSLKPTFTASSKSTVTVNGVAQTSDSSVVDFTSPVVFEVKAQDGSIQDYKVTVTTDIVSIDNVVASFMSSYNIPGLSIAITLNENLVYVKGYGQADVADNQNMKTQNLFRIASLSKQITSVAIMKLLDQGKIHLTDTVFGQNGILGNTFGTQPYGANITNITIDELLHHTAGGWTNDGSDPMFTNPTMTAQQLISWTLDSRPLSNVPGTTYAYSNFGYCILGRVIEKITGMSYVNAATSLVLQPCGISDMVIGGNTIAERIANEVVYYGQGGENPYVYNITRMDSHGGWLASATDLARFLVHIDGFPNKQDIISSNAINVMTTPSAANPGYACGWAVNNSNNWWHQGSLPGTATEQARTVSGGKFNFVILTNTRSQNANFSGDLDNLFWTALSGTANWPTYDLF
jgi:D-alanyl-D-alanine carboxypeptidase